MDDTNTNLKDYGTNAYSDDLAEDAGHEDESENEDALEENPDFDDELEQLDHLDDEPE